MLTVLYLTALPHTSPISVRANRKKKTIFYADFFHLFFRNYKITNYNNNYIDGYSYKAVKTKFKIS